MSDYVDVDKKGNVWVITQYRQGKKLRQCEAASRETAFDIAGRWA